MMTTQNLLVELFVEELPPKALKKLGEAFAGELMHQLKAQGLTAPASALTSYASPRRLGAHITAVAARAADQAVTKKLMPVSVGLDASGHATPALLKKLQALGVDVSNPAAVVAQLKQAPDGKALALFYDSVVTGVTLQAGLQKALEEAIARLPIPKVMSYQLESDCELPGWSSVSFVRPAHGLVALHGTQVVPVTALGLQAGNRTHGHRFEASVDPIALSDADSYAQTLLTEGAVIASFNDRRFAIVQQLAQAAERLGPGFEVLLDEALLDEVTALVERPNVLTCSFEPEFLAVPQECLILTMKANQKYFPLLDQAGKLTNKFLVVSNISPKDASAVIGGNERVVRPRLSDAKFFFDKDRKTALTERVAALDKVVYHNKLGTQGQRSQRVRAIAAGIASNLNSAIASETRQSTSEAAKGMDRRGLRPRDDEPLDLAGTVDVAARLAKTDLLTDMVGEFPELQGIMGGYYARHDGLGEAVALAIEDHYKPRFAGDELPRNPAGVVLALADKLETLVGMFGIGNLPSGDKDPFALRRHALGVIRMLIEKNLALDLDALLALALPCFGSLIQDPSAALTDFIFERLAGTLREQHSAQEVDAVLALRPQRLSEVAQRLTAVHAFAALPEAAALAAANKRISNILKKSAAGGTDIDAALLQEAAEKALYSAMQQVARVADAQFAAQDYRASLQSLATLRAPVDGFFDQVMVNAEQPDLRLNRLALLKTLHQTMNRVADLSRLAS